MSSLRLPRTVRSAAEAGLNGTVLALGNFDGVHRGHRALLGRMSELATELGLPAVAVSFFPTSRMVFSDAGFLSSEREKALLLAEFDPAAVVLIPFSHDYAQTSSGEFLQDLATLGPAAITVGADFRFGRDRSGSLNDLSLVTRRLEVFNLLECNGTVISSSRIRELLASGDVAGATELLGAPYLVLGTVERGDQRGRTIGFPTANLAVPEGKVLPHGVFAVRITVSGQELGGMANVGPRPSFPDGAPALEVNLFDFDADIYGQELAVRFIGRIRSQQRFSGLEELKQRLAQDAVEARRILSDEGAAG